MIRMNHVPFRKDDQEAVMSHVGPVLPLLLREAVDDGFHKYAKSRALDPEGFIDYDQSCRANMLYKRVVSSARYLADGAKEAMSDLRYKISDNRCATEFMYGPYIVFRFKRIKKNRKNLTTGVLTQRNRLIRSSYCQSVGQLNFPFPNDIDFLPPEYRVWVTVAWDLDEVEEKVSRAVIGVETRKRWLWLRPLAAGEPEVLASLPAPIADRMQEVRQRRAN